MNFFGDKPSSRVLRPPGGGSSNIIFGGSDEAPNSGSNSKPKPTYQSSVFDTTPEPVQQRAGSRQGGSTSSNIFGSDSDSNNTATTPKKISNTHQSSIFAEPEETVQNQKKVSRRDPITGASLDESGDKEQNVNGQKKEGTSCKENGDQTSAEPHLGAVKKTSGIRTAQPPGGKSSITFG